MPCLSVKYTFLIKSSGFDQFTISPSSKIIWPDSVIADKYNDSSELQITESFGIPALIAFEIIG